MMEAARDATLAWELQLRVCIESKASHVWFYRLSW